MKQFIKINPQTGRTIGAKIKRKDKIRYQYKDADTGKFISRNEFRRRYRAYKAELKRKDKRQISLSDRACMGYSAYNRSAIKKACNVVICGVWAEEDNIIYTKPKGGAK